MSPEINKELCTVCESCVEECPSDVFAVGKDKEAIIIADEENCTECGTCELACPEGAITIRETKTLNEIS